MKKAFKQDKAITLIALVVTIIVLIILAGVSINLLLGENGMITKAREGKANYEWAANEEKVSLDSFYENMNQKIQGTDNNMTSAKTKALNDLRTYFSKPESEIYDDYGELKNVEPITNASSTISYKLHYEPKSVFKYDYSPTEHIYFSFIEDDITGDVIGVEEIELDAKISRDENNRIVLTTPFGTYYESVEGETRHTWRAHSQEMEPSNCVYEVTIPSNYTHYYDINGFFISDNSR